MIAQAMFYLSRQDVRIGMAQATHHVAVVSSTFRDLTNLRRHTQPPIPTATVSVRVCLDVKENLHSNPMHPSAGKVDVRIESLSTTRKTYCNEDPNAAVRSKLNIQRAVDNSTYATQPAQEQQPRRYRHRKAKDVNTAVVQCP